MYVRTTVREYCHCIFSIYTCQFMSSSAHMLPLPLDATSPPSRVTASCIRAMSTSFHIIWSKPDAEYAIELNWHHPAVETINGSVNAYILEYGESGSSAPPSSISLSGVVEEHTVTGLKPHTEYYVKVAAVNAAGRGPFCEPVLVQTVPDSECLIFFTCKSLSQCHAGTILAISGSFEKCSVNR